MGAETFTQSVEDPDAKTAFDAAVSDAAYTYGHDGYTGTIAEKSEFVIIQHHPLTLDDAQELAHKLIDAGDPRIDDKWGPAGAIPYGTPDDVDLTEPAAVEAWLATDPPIRGWVFFGWASS